MTTGTCVLLSGGMDSTCCLFWALRHCADVRAVAFDYGQPHREAELRAARSLAARHSVPLEVLSLTDALGLGLLSAVPEHETTPTRAIHSAFVPGRNLVFLSLALARACVWWPNGEPITLVIGATLEDTSGFPDCTIDFVRQAEQALSTAVAREVRVMPPFVSTTKVEMLREAARWPSALAEVQASWSCYAGKGPCGKCTPCALRAEAFAAVGLLDLCGEASG